MVDPATRGSELLPLPPLIVMINEDKILLVNTMSLRIYDVLRCAYFWSDRTKEAEILQPP
jgi:hypothetical protein